MANSTIKHHETTLTLCYFGKRHIDLKSDSGKILGNVSIENGQIDGFTFHPDLAKDYTQALELVGHLQTLLSKH